MLPQSFAKRYPFYMAPATAAALLRTSRELRRINLIRRELRAELREHSFSNSAAGELAELIAPAPAEPLAGWQIALAGAYGMRRG